MHIIDLIQDTDPWLDWRSYGIGASEVSTIIGINPSKTPYQLWAELTGLIPRPDLSKNPHVNRGKRYEPIARRIYETATHDHFLPICIEHPLYEPLRASLDGYSEKTNTVLEIKCPCEQKFKEVLDKKRFSSSYLLYYSQVQYQLLCTDNECEDGVLFFYCTERTSNNTMAFKIKANSAYQDWLKAKVLWFWDCVITGNPPALDPERDVLKPEFVNDACFDEWEHLTLELVDTLREKKKFEDKVKILAKEQADIQNRIVSCFGDFRSGELAGVKLSVSTRKGRVNYKQLIEDLELLYDIDVDEYRGKYTSSIMYSVDKKRGDDLTEKYLTNKHGAILRTTAIVGNISINSVKF